MIPYGEIGRGVRVLRRGIRLRLAVDGRRRGEDEPHACVDARLEDPLRRDQVPANVEREDVAEAADARLRREMEDPVDAGEIERLLGQIDAAHVEPARVLLFLGGVVVVGEAVDADDVVALLEQRAAQAASR